MRHALNLVVFGGLVFSAATSSCGSTEVVENAAGGDASANAGGDGTGTAMGGGGVAGASTTGSGGEAGAGGSPMCEAQPVDGFAHWPVPADHPVTENYDTSIPGIVKDKTTGLTWQQDFGERLSWSDAGEYCSRLTIAGHCDWRVPTRMELLSLVDYGEFPVGLDGAINLEVFPMPIEYDLWGFWTSSQYPLDSVYAWRVQFRDGNSKFTFKTHDSYVRCVR